SCRSRTSLLAEEPRDAPRIPGGLAAPAIGPHPRPSRIPRQRRRSSHRRNRHPQCPRPRPAPLARPCHPLLAGSPPLFADSLLPARPPRRTLAIVSRSATWHETVIKYGHPTWSLGRLSS